MLPKESMWYYLLALVLSIFYYFEIHKALNFKSMVLTNKGLLLKMRFEKDIFYPYGSFVAQFIIRRMIRFEEVVSFMSNNICKSFAMPNGYDSLGSFKNNQEFKELCTKYTNQALESLNPQEKANLYKLYQSNIENFFGEIINHNVFIIDFDPYKAEIESYLKDKNETTF